MSNLRTAALVIVITLSQVSDCKWGPAVHQLTDPVDHGEGPTWDYRTNRLYFVDIFAGRVLSYDPLTSEINAISLGGDVTPVIPTINDPHRFVAGVNRSVYAFEWDGRKHLGATKVLTSVSQQFPTSRFNDGKADKEGRLWFGTMGYEDASGVAPNEGVLYLITKENLASPFPVLYPVNISNGLAWNRANDKFYYIDTPTRKVVEYDYDNPSGRISNPKVVFDLSRYNTIGGSPDGMTIDVEDKLWIALYGGGAVIRVNPQTGNVMQMVPIPAQSVTSVSWGGPNLDILFVTTSRHSLNAQERIRQPAAGSLFAIKNLKTRGLPAFFTNVF